MLYAVWEERGLGPQGLAGGVWTGILSILGGIRPELSGLGGSGKPWILVPTLRKLTETDKGWLTRRPLCVKRIGTPIEGISPNAKLDASTTHVSKWY